MLHAQDRSRIEHVYTPTVWRLILANCFLPIAACLLGVLASYLPELMQGVAVNWTSSLRFAAIFLAVVLAGNLLLIGFNRDWYAIKIEPDSVSGPAIFGGRKSILVSEIDRRRTAQQSRWAKLLRSHQIWDTRGNNISLSEMYFPLDQITEILAIIGRE